MSWVRNNVSKSISQKRVFNAAPSTYQPIFQSREAINETISQPTRKSIKESLKNQIIENSDSESNNLSLKYIDAILYINLEHRKDRLEHIKKEISKINPTLSKAQRIDAVKHEIGALGCTLSHIKALQLFISNPSWNTCMILEDDFTFISNEPSEIHNSLISFFDNVKDFDMLLLGTGVKDYKDDATEYPMIRKVLSSQTASGYIITRKYIFTLLANFLKGSNLIKKEGLKEEYCLDQYWKQLMPIGKWYALEKRVGFQYSNYSDIEKKVVEYNC
jgi:glycosyl transferase family 25